MWLICIETICLVIKVSQIFLKTSPIANSKGARPKTSSRSLYSNKTILTQILSQIPSTTQALTFKDLMQLRSAKITTLSKSLVACLAYRRPLSWRRVSQYCLAISVAINLNRGQDQLIAPLTLWVSTIIFKTTPKTKIYKFRPWGTSYTSPGKYK